jgi:hypothetical protein
MLGSSTIGIQQGVLLRVKAAESRLHNRRCRVRRFARIAWGHVRNEPAISIEFYDVACRDGGYCHEQRASCLRSACWKNSGLDHALE